MHRPHISWVKLQPHTGDFIHVYGGTTEMVLEHVLDKTASTNFCFKCFPDLLSMNHYGNLLSHTNHLPSDTWMNYSYSIPLVKTLRRVYEQSICWMIYLVESPSILQLTAPDNNFAQSSWDIHYFILKTRHWNTFQRTDWEINQYRFR